MSTKNMVLQKLENNREAYISGEQLASALNISRSAVWKAIKELRQEGYIISAVTNKGYILSAQNDIVSSEGIKVFLDDKTIAPNIFVYKTLSSTNQIAKQLAGEGEKSGTVVIANQQTAGRGRMGRGFFSPPDSGIYMSIILRPKLSAQKGILLTTAASLAVCYAIENTFGVCPKIKWVNDIIYNGKKICGILTEAVTDFESGNIEHVVIGIGINVFTEDFPEEIKHIAGSLQSHEGRGVIRNRLIAGVISSINHIIPNVELGAFIEEYKKRSIVLGKNIEIIQHNNVAYGKAVDINDVGGLVVQLDDGSRQTIISGEVSIRGEFYND